MDLQKELHGHFEEDVKNFKKIDERFDFQEKDHEEFRKSLNQIKIFMENMQGLSDFVKGTSLLKKPMMWVIGFIIGIIALMGGLKTIIGWFILSK